MNKAELSYPTSETQLLAIIWVGKYYRPYLYGRKFRIYTDHGPLVYLFNIKDPSSSVLKFTLTLGVKYVKDTENRAADALSRIQLTSEELKGM